MGSAVQVHKSSGAPFILDSLSTPSLLSAFHVVRCCYSHSGSASVQIYSAAPPLPPHSWQPSAALSTRYWQPPRRASTRCSTEPPSML